MDDEEDAYAAVCGAGRALGYVCASSMYQRVMKSVLMLHQIFQFIRLIEIFYITA